MTARKDEPESAEQATPVTLQLEEAGYRFRVDFGLPGAPPLLMDEPEPLGEGSGPNAPRLLVAAVVNCLSASLLFCLRKARLEVRGMRASGSAMFTRSEAGRLRVQGIRVRIEPEVVGGESGRLRRCLEIFEDYCVVTQSVRGGIDVDVEVATTSAEAA
ncbi:MAG TPA: OsmC family protein [Actinomycetota bacterium]